MTAFLSKDHGTDVWELSPVQTLPDGHEEFLYWIHHARFESFRVFAVAGVAGIYT